MTVVDSLSLFRKKWRSWKQITHEVFIFRNIFQAFWKINRSIEVRTCSHAILSKDASDVINVIGHIFDSRVSNPAIEEMVEDYEAKEGMWARVEINLDERLFLQGKY